MIQHAALCATQLWHIDNLLDYARKHDCTKIYNSRTNGSEGAYEKEWQQNPEHPRHVATRPDCQRDPILDGLSPRSQRTSNLGVGQRKLAGSFVITYRS